MKQVTFAAGLIALGLVLGQAMPQVFAQTPQPQVQKWEHFCEGHDGLRAVKRANESMATHEKKGYALIGVGVGDASLVVCFRRPVQ